MINVFIEREQTTKKIEFTNQTVQELLDELGINSETVLVVQENTVLTEDQKIQDSKKIDIISVVSGG